MHAVASIFIDAEKETGWCRWKASSGDPLLLGWERKSERWVGNKEKGGREGARTRRIERNAHVSSDRP